MLAADAEMAQGSTFAEREPILPAATASQAQPSAAPRPPVLQRRHLVGGLCGSIAALIVVSAVVGLPARPVRFLARSSVSEGVSLALASGSNSTNESSHSADKANVTNRSHTRRPVAPVTPPKNSQQVGWQESTQNGVHLSGGNEAKLLGKTLRVNIDVSQVGCGCVAGFYLYQGFEPYCDASGNFDGRCGEIDLFEGNKFAWHSTLHNTMDHPGLAGGFGGTQQPDMMYGKGPRDMTGEQYGPGGSIIDTEKAFQAAISFPKGQDGGLADMVIMLYQEGKDHAIEWRVNKMREKPGMDCQKSDCENCFSKPGCIYRADDMQLFGQWLTDGMTMQSTLWPTDEPWLDGTIDGEKGGCPVNPGEPNSENYGTYQGAHSECGLHHPWYRVGDWTLEDIEEPASGWQEIFEMMDDMPLVPTPVKHVMK